MTFVDLPGLGDGNPHAVGLFQNVPQGADGTLLEGGEGNIGLDSGLGNELSSLGGLDVSGLTQWAIVPTGELVGKVPGGLSVSDQNQGVLVGLLGGGETVGKLRNLKKKIMSEMIEYSVDCHGVCFANHLASPKIQGEGT